MLKPAILFFRVLRRYNGTVNEASMALGPIPCLPKALYDDCSHFLGDRTSSRASSRASGSDSSSGGGNNNSNNSLPAQLHLHAMHSGIQESQDSAAAIRACRVKKAVQEDDAKRIYCRATAATAR